MRRVFTMIAVIVLAGCGSSSGPDPSTWLGTWSVQVTNGSGWHVNPLQYHLTLVDSANDMGATVGAFAHAHGPHGARRIGHGRQQHRSGKFLAIHWRQELRRQRGFGLAGRLGARHEQRVDL